MNLTKYERYVAGRALCLVLGQERGSEALGLIANAENNPVQAGRRHDGERVVPLSVLLRPHNR